MSDTTSSVSENNTLKTSLDAPVTTLAGGTGDRAVKSNALTEFRDTSKITASGGSHQIATRDVKLNISEFLNFLNFCYIQCGRKANKNGMYVENQPIRRVQLINLLNHMTQANHKL